MKQNRPNLALRVAAVLIVLVCISTVMLSGILGRYTAEGESEDSARVATFSVSAVASGGSGVQNISGQSAIAQYELTLTNASEVAVSYEVVLTFDEALPDWVTVALGELSGDISADRKTVTFQTSGALAVNSQTTETISFTATAAGLAQTGKDNLAEATLNFTVDVEFVQID